MKKILLSLSIISFTISVFAQNSSAVFFSENGERFFIIVNGLRQNENAETNVKISGLNPTAYKVRVIFEDKSYGIIDKNIYCEEYKEYTYQIKRKSDAAAEGYPDKYLLKGYSIVDLPRQRPAPVPQQNNYSAPPTTTTTVTHSTTTVNPAPSGGQFSMSLNLGGGMGDNIGMNMNVNDGGAYHESTTTTTTTSTTSNSMNHNENDHYIMPGYNGPVGCSWPMSEHDFNQAKGTIASKSFEDSKLTIAKQIINSNCLFSKQVREIMLLFSFEATRLDFAKYAYGYTYDLKNYYKVNDAFTFESSIDDLNNFIGNQK